MALISWTPQLSVGVSKFDEQHKELIRLINELHEAMLSSKTREVLGDLLKRLSDYTEYHFSDEEKLMKLHNYPKYSDQKKAHDSLVVQVKDEIAKYSSGLPVTMEVMHFLKNWLTKHIMIEDKEYGSFFNNKGIK